MKPAPAASAGPMTDRAPPARAEVQLAAAVIRADHPDARLALALRLCDAVDPVVTNENVDSVPSEA